MRRFHIASVLSLAAFVSGCGGDEGPNVLQASLPQFSNDIRGFARGGEAFPTTVTFVGSDDLGGFANSANLTVRSANDGSGNLILVNDAGETFTLRRGASGEYSLNTGGTSLLVQGAFSDDVGALVLVQGTETGNRFSGVAGFGVIGRESTDVGRQRGNAIYVGPSAYFIVSNDTGDIGGGSGGFVLAADFDRAAVDGRIALTDSSSTQFLLDFRDAPITGNGFATSNLTQTGLNGTITSSRLSAKFYGGNAAQVGGIYGVDIAAGGGSGSASLRGVLVGNRQSFNVDDLIAAAAAEQAGGAQGGGGQASINTGRERIVLGSGSVVGGSGSVYPGGASSYYNSNTGASFGADGSGCYYVGDWSNC